MVLYWENLTQVTVANIVVGSIGVVAIVLSLIGGVIEECAMRRSVALENETQLKDRVWCSLSNVGKDSGVVKKE